MEKEPKVSSENFLFKKTDFLPTFHQFPKNSPVSRTTTDVLPTTMQPEKEDSQDLIEAEKGVISTTMTISMKLSKETHMGGHKTLTREDKSVEDVSSTENKEKLRMYYLLLPLFMLLVAFMCLLCILTVLVC